MTPKAHYRAWCQETGTTPGDGLDDWEAEFGAGFEVMQVFVFRASMGQTKQTLPEAIRERLDGDQATA